jgi:adenosylmethionine-8-amino-7-oxononanoate aminotransferase
LPEAVRIPESLRVWTFSASDIRAKRAFAAFVKAFEEGILIRTTGDIIAMSPPLIISKAQIDELIGKLAGILKTLD